MTKKELSNYILNMSPWKLESLINKFSIQKNRRENDELFRKRVLDYFLQIRDKK
jgi:hypothetical protein